MSKGRNLALSADVVEYARAELLAYRRNEPLTCAVLKFNNRPYVVLHTNNGVVAMDEDGVCWATQILDGLIAYDDPPPLEVGSGHRRIGKLERTHA
jgi:hypothetical protein